MIKWQNQLPGRRCTHGREHPTTGTTHGVAHPGFRFLGIFGRILRAPQKKCHLRCDIVNQKIGGHRNKYSPMMGAVKFTGMFALFSRDTARSE